MAIGVLVLGESGTGKTYSIKNFDPADVKILSVQKPILPFRGKYDVVKTPTSTDVVRELKNTKKKFIVVDDFQYILGIPMMQRIGEKGWEKFNEIQQGYSDILDTINELPDDSIVFLNSHVMYNDETGRTQIKTIGKALDKYITVEGLFMIVLGTQVVDGKYYFITQNNGSNTLKSPEGMFPSMAIPNDLRYVADKILNYYYMDGAKSDAVIAEEDVKNTVSDEEVKPARRGRRNRGEEKKEEPAETPKEEEKPRRKRSELVEEAAAEYLDKVDEMNEEKGDEIPFDEVETPEPEMPRRKRRSVEEVTESSKEPVVEEPVQEEAPRHRRRRVE